MRASFFLRVYWLDCFFIFKFQLKLLCFLTHVFVWNRVSELVPLETVIVAYGFDWKTSVGRFGHRFHFWKGSCFSSQKRFFVYFSILIFECKTKIWFRPFLQSFYLAFQCRRTQNSNVHFLRWKKIVFKWVHVSLNEVFKKGGRVVYFFFTIAVLITFKTRHRIQAQLLLITKWSLVFLNFFQKRV